MHCSVAQCLEVVGAWWSMLIVRDAFFGVTRFDDFQERLGISRNILLQRLNRLVEAGVLTRVAYSEHPPRSDYRLTDRGRDLWPVLNAMREWGDKYAAPLGPPLLMTHSSCGQVFESVQTCSACGETRRTPGRSSLCGAWCRRAVAPGVGSGVMTELLEVIRRPFSEVSAVVARGTGTFDARVDESWTIGGRPNGGYLLAILGQAAATVTAHPDVIAASAHYVRSPEPEGRSSSRRTC